MSNLVIVESPSKAKTIEKYLGSDYTVVSSLGHVCDLSTKGKGGLGIDIENGFIPNYVISEGKDKVVKELKKLVKKSDNVFLASDPDREGEAISWHLARILELDPNLNNRIVFNEITKKSISAAIQKPRKIDMDLVYSQETRRMLDRILGFKLSQLLRSKIKSQSAGRVQSVALKLIVDKEKEINAFVSEEYWTIHALFEGFEAELAKYKGNKIELKEEKDAEEVLNNLSNEFIVSKIEKTEKSKSPKAPFITSSLQQEASTKLNFNPKKTMRIAQKLYEGIDIGSETVGLITYMRTDSFRLSDEFIAASRNYIETNYGKEYLGFYKAKTKENAQDAHEAIRVTSIMRTPKEIKQYLTNDEYNLYNLIYCRCLASQMANAKFDATKLILENNGYEFNASGSIMNFDGYLKVYAKFEQNKDELLPLVVENEKLCSNSIEKKQHFTQPPARYSEAKLVKTMEELGIGRPSTYATIVDTIQSRKYVELQKTSKKTGVLVPTEQGILTSEKLDEFFSNIINVKYTATMEESLDTIAEGNLEYKQYLTDFYQNFEPIFEKANKEMEKIKPEPTGETCPECGSEMVYRINKYTKEKFEACSNYPTCKYIKNAKEKIVEYTGENCPKCNSPMIWRTNKKTNEKFAACSAFPKCRYIKTNTELEYSGNICEKCGGRMVYRTKKKDGTKFEACENFPKCRLDRKKKEK